MIGCAPPVPAPPPLRIRTGHHVELTHTSGSRVQFFDRVSLEAEIIATVPTGTECLVREGPRIISGITLWRVFCVDADVLGWVNANWLIPID